MTALSDRQGAAAGLPLDGVRVLDLSRFLPGPHCAMMLADMGAEVIRIEQARDIAKRDDVFARGTKERRSRAERRAYEATARHKKSVMLDLKQDAGREIVCRLAGRCDVLIEDYRPGVTGEMGLDYETIRRANPAIVYCSISMCGQDGPYRDLPGHDPIALALSGALSLMGEADRPPLLPGVAAGDITASLHAAFAILCALRVKERDGVGQHIDIGMTDCAMSLMIMAYQRYFQDGFLPRRGWKSAHNGVWRTADGRFICTTNLEPRYWADFCRVIGREEMIPWQHDMNRRKELMETVEQIMLTRTRDEWFEIFRNAGLQAAPVYEINEAAADPHIRHRGLIAEIETPESGPVRQLAQPIRLSATPARRPKAPAQPGRHTSEILNELGYSPDEIRTLADRGCIVCPEG